MYNSIQIRQFAVILVYILTLLANIGVAYWVTNNDYFDMDFIKSKYKG